MPEIKKYIKRLFCFHDYRKYYGYTQMCIKCQKLSPLTLKTMSKQMYELEFSCKFCLEQTQRQFEEINISKYAKLSSIGIKLFHSMYKSFHEYHKLKEPPCDQ